MKKNILILFTLILSLSVFSQVHIIRQESFSFNPIEIEVNIGDTIRWEWTGGTHTTTSLEIPVGADAWDNPLSSTTQFFEYKVLTEGIYNYKCTPHQAMGMTGSFTAALPLISNNISSSSFSIYPNPANDLIYIETETSELLTMTIFNFSGQILMEYEINDNQTIDISDLSSGIYFYQIKNSDQTYVTANKIIKE